VNNAKANVRSTENVGAREPGDRQTPEQADKALTSISLPKGGGAIRGIGEKFSVNAVTGTASLSVPLVFSPGRNDFGPRLSLSYDSGTGNGLFGFGWSMSLPAVTRKTDKGLPRYRDHEDSDVFIISGAEDLVPILDAKGARIRLQRKLAGVDYAIRLYRPRIEGLFARIERWTDDATGISHWRSITRDNVTTLFGTDANSRVADPQDPQRVFSYLIASTFDSKGNATVYEYAAEDGAGVNPAVPHEANRVAADRIAQRYPKRIRFGNVQPYFPAWPTQGALPPQPADWHFSVVFDYGDHAPDAPVPAPDRPWPVRPDPFSAYRAGFEIRTYRRCARVLLFHDFPDEQNVGVDCLVRSSDLTYSDQLNPADPRNPIYTMLASAAETGYRRIVGGYDKRSLPPVEFEYSTPEIDAMVRGLGDAVSRSNLPEGLDGVRHRWVDLDSEGLSGVLSPAGGGWNYKRNLSPVNLETLADGSQVARARLGALERVASLPVGADLGPGQQLVDLTGGGLLDLARFEGPVPGYFGRTGDAGWEPFRAFRSLPGINWSEPNLQFVDVTGDGRPDVLITEEEVFTFYPSLGRDGFGPGERTLTAHDERRGPHLVYADGTQTISLADMTGDGLRDLVRVRNGEVCYWPNLGYGWFGPRITMDASPRFTDDERYDPKRVRLADIDGSGTTDLLYVGPAGVMVCFNRSGNGWAAPHLLAVFPGADMLSSVQALDLLGNGTSCLVWSSPLPGEGYRSLRYVDLMSGHKPHLLMRIRNNLGAETRLAYAPSTQFYLQDKQAGRPWITRLPFPVQCVARVETYDWIARSRFITRYAYHHGYFDGEEREFRGFGMVEQTDTERHGETTLFPGVITRNEDDASFNPPTLTRTWFHTGAFFDAGIVSKQCASEYWIEPAMRGDAPAAIAARNALQLPDSTLEDVLTAEEIREAYRALKGSALRIEVYGLDSSPKQDFPYSVKEQNFTVRRLQGFGPNQHACFLSHARESVTLRYERQVGDPRISHDITLETDLFAQVKRSVSIAYPRRAGFPAPEPLLSANWQAMLRHDQTRLHVGATAHDHTAPVHTLDEAANFDVYRGPLPSETITAELTGFASAGSLFRFAEIDARFQALWPGGNDIPYEDVSTPDIEGVGVPVGLARRIVERSRTLYRSDDLTTLLPLGTAQPLGLPGETYHLALTTGLIARIFGGRLADADIQEGGYVRLAGQNDWWVPSGRVFFSPGDADTPAQELAAARAHFFRPRRAVDPFGGIDRRDFDAYDLLPITSTDPVGNITLATNDYRVLHSVVTIDPNGNTSAVAMDCLGHVTGSAVAGKAGEGDSLAAFDADLTNAAIAAVRADPLANPGVLLGNATSRYVYDLFAYMRTRDLAAPDPPMLYTLARETHVSDLAIGQATRFHHVFVYWDGFGREAQHKAQAEPGPLVDGGPNVVPRWVGSGWEIHNNKGKPVRKYEPFFSDTHHFVFDAKAGVSSVLFYDPTERIVSVLHPDSSFEKTAFNAWRQEDWDVNDTAGIDDPRADADVGDFYRRLLGPAPGAFTSWVNRRIGGALGATPAERDANKDAALKTQAHVGTTTVTHYDALGRKSLVVADNGVVAGVAQRFPVRTAMDTEDKPLVTIDARERHVMEMCLREPIGAGFRYVAGYGVTGHPLYRDGMDGGERRTLSNVAGNVYRHWDARGQSFRTLYDPAHRPTHRFITQTGGAEFLSEFLIYGELHPDAARNLRGKLFRHYDTGGMASHDRYDFRENAAETGRQLAAGYRSLPDWAAVAGVPLAAGPALDLAALDAAGAALLDADGPFVASGRYDALNRIVQTVTPHVVGGAPSVLQPSYNEANLLERLNVWVRRGGAPAGLLDPATADVPAIMNIDYNARGQRAALELGCGSRTAYVYDPETFRVATLTTTRPDPQPDARMVQALSYTYDPKGNITRLRDDADIHDVIYFQNQRVDPTADYTYDPIYRLTSATGREHLGLNGVVLNAPAQVTNDDGLRTGILLPGDGNAAGNYTESYEYDATGNILKMIHQVATGRWTRCYTYTEASAVTAAEISNRLSTTSRAGDDPKGPYSNAYDYDAHGNMIRMQHLPGMSWDAHDRLQSSSRQVVNAGTPETTYYAYDEPGDRLRKATDRQAAQGVAATRRKERIYLGLIELYREYAADGIAITLEREILHVMLDQRRVALVETRTVGLDPAPPHLVRYQYSNHLSSALLELDDRAAVISYEEYFPYGSTSFHGVRAQNETPKRYRYTGKERDEENDLDYHGARYCAPWLGRWISCDPAGLDDGPNVYLYVHCNPVAYSDPTGMWGWREVAIVAAVVVVGTVVTVATAGVAGPIVAGAVASVGLTGATATVATGVVVGAVAGAAGGAASELTRQVASGEEVSGKKIGQAALTGAAAGAVTGGLSSLASVRQGAMAASAARASARSVGTYARGVASSAGHGAVGGGVAEGTRQLINGEKLDVGRIATAAGQGAVVGGAVRAASPVVRPLISPVSRVPGVGRVVTAPTRAGIALGRRAFPTAGSVGREAVEAYAASLNDPVRQAALTGGRFERRVESHLQTVEGQTDIARQVTIRPYQDAQGTLAPMNTRVRADNLGRQSGAIAITDAKASGAAPFTANQQRGYPLLEQFGGVVVGNKGGALYPAGTVIPPTTIDVYRPGPNNTIVKGGI
jgi:RHS repeat-associated protein